MATLARFEAGPDGFTEARRRPYGWAMLCAREALGELTRRDADFKAAQELLARIRREREEARRAWDHSRTSQVCSINKGVCQGDECLLGNFLTNGWQ